MITGLIAEPTTEPRPVENSVMGAASNLLGDGGVVVDVGKAPFSLIVRHHVHEVEPGFRRADARADHAHDRLGAALGISADRFFLYVREPASDIAAAEAGLIEGRIMFPGFGHRRFDGSAKLRCRRARRHMRLAAKELAELLEDRAAAALDDVIAGDADCRVRGNAAARIRSAALRADHEVAEVQRDPRGITDALYRLPKPVPPGLYSCARAAAFLDD